MHKRELVAAMVSASRAALHAQGHTGRKTVSVKIRVHPDLRATVDFVRTVQDAGVDFITIHGRRRSTRSSEPVDLDAIRVVREHISVPVLSNGDVFSLGDAVRHCEATGADGVMAARGLLENPALFRGHETTPWEAIEYFMGRLVRAPIPFKLVVHHLGEMGGSDRGGGTTGEERGRSVFGKEERRGLMACRDMLELMDWLDGVREVRRTW